jgi:hypothetical protein
MTNNATITIDDKEYAIDALPEAAQVNLARAQQLQREIADLQMLLEERQLTLQARQNAVVKAVQEAEFEAANEAANPAESGSVQEAPEQGDETNEHAA